jgi:para-nitrobenzyl esterase
VSTRLTGGGPEAVALADRVSDAWIAFARTGDPNTKKLPRWPKFNATERPTMVFNTVSKVENDPIKEQRLAIWKALNF